MLGDANGCFILARFTHEPSYRHHLLARACASRSLEGCMLAALGLLHGVGVTRNVAEGQRGLSAACDKGLATACGALAVGLQSGEYGEPDMVRAAELGRRACAMGSRAACEHFHLPVPASDAQ